MKYRRLGNTGLAISEVCLGTVQLGMNYGFPATHYYNNPDETSATPGLQQTATERFDHALSAAGHVNASVDKVEAAR